MFLSITNIHRSVMVLFFLLPLAFTIQAQQYTPTDENSKVEFKIVNHLLGKQTVTGTLQGLTGKIVFNKSAPGASSFDVAVKVGTIHTGIGKRDQDLKKEKFFDADKYPGIRIKSTKVERGDKTGTYVLHGNLIMKGISKAVAIPFTATPSDGGCTFNGTLSLNRSDYHVGDKEGKIEDGLTVSLQVYAKKG
jgi:polyisoprenoid-binding protein YceI